MQAISTFIAIIAKIGPEKRSRNCIWAAFHLTNGELGDNSGFCTPFVDNVVRKIVHSPLSF